MRHVFIAGTDTNIGKTLVSSWLCLHTRYDYFKPIQTGCSEGTDSQIVSQISNSKIHKEIYLYKEPVSPHLAASLKNEEIDISRIKLPSNDKIVVEGAGGVLVPINKNAFIIDLIKHLSIPVILVTSSRMGTINHTLLTLEALNIRNIKTLGVIVNGHPNQFNCEAIAFYGKTKILAQVPYLDDINKNTLSKILLTQDLKRIFKM